ncbi:hypothetical protein LINPERPRIM_LOCUS8464 [Linum perenne]
MNEGLPPLYILSYMQKIPSQQPAIVALFFLSMSGNTKPDDPAGWSNEEEEDRTDKATLLRCRFVYFVEAIFSSNSFPAEIGAGDRPCFLEQRFKAQLLGFHSESEVTDIGGGNCCARTAGVRVLPVMLMGAFIPRQRMKSLTHEYISELHLVVGLILFTLADAKIASNFSVSGLSEFQVLLSWIPFEGICEKPFSP